MHPDLFIVNRRVKLVNEIFDCCVREGHCPHPGCSGIEVPEGTIGTIVAVDTMDNIPRYQASFLPDEKLPSLYEWGDILHVALTEDAKDYYLANWEDFSMIE